MPVYEVPVDGSGSHDDPYHARHADDIGADPSNYLHHYRRGVVYVASNVPIDVYEDRVDDEGSPVRLHSEEDGTDEYPAPAAEAEDGAEAEAEEEYPCPHCDRSFDTPQGRAGHMRTHSDD